MTSLLYITTGLLVAAETYWLLMWAIWGAPTNAWEYAALAGSLLLLIAGAVHIWKKTIGTWMATAALLLIWSFYLPAAIETIRATRHYASYSLQWLRPLVVLMLLITSSVFAFRQTAILLIHRKKSSPHL